MDKFLVKQNSTSSNNPINNTNEDELTRLKKELQEKNTLILQLREQQGFENNTSLHNKKRRLEEENATEDCSKDLQIKKLTEENKTLKKRLGVPSGKTKKIVSFQNENAASSSSSSPTDQVGADSNYIIRVLNDRLNSFRAEFSEKIDNLTKRFDRLNHSCVPSNGFKGEVATLKKELKSVLETAKKSANVDTTVVKVKMESAWSEVVNRRKPGVLPMKTIIREQLEQ